MQRMTPRGKCYHFIVVLVELLEVSGGHYAQELVVKDVIALSSSRPVKGVVGHNITLVLAGVIDRVDYIATSFMVVGRRGSAQV